MSAEEDPNISPIPIAEPVDAANEPSIKDALDENYQSSGCYDIDKLSDSDETCEKSSNENTSLSTFSGEKKGDSVTRFVGTSSMVHNHEAKIGNNQNNFLFHREESQPSPIAASPAENKVKENAIARLIGLG